VNLGLMNVDTTSDIKKYKEIPKILIHFLNLELKMHLSQRFCDSRFNAILSKGIEP
jgi:hypothetical protein